MKPKFGILTQPFGNVKRVHFIGIGGAGMSGIAAVLLSLNYEVTGSDLKATEVTDSLTRRGAKIHFGHKAGNVTGSDVVVYSAAVPMDNPEIVEAHKRSIPVIPRTEMLAELMRLKYGIAISGTHGKTTTTSMIGLIMTEAKLDPTLVIGGQVDVFKSNAKLGRSTYLVAEACEAFGEFFLLSPMISIVTNIDDDHLDYYGSIDKVRDAFVTFANKVPFYGCVILGIDDKQVQMIAPQVKRRVITYGLTKDAQVSAGKIKLEKAGSTFEVTRLGKRLGTVKLKVPGRFNIQNALAAISVGLELKVPFKTMAAGLAKFHGAQRRFEIKGSFKGATVIDDYAHHPTAVSETLRAARNFAGSRKLVVAFQPHLFSRTQLLRDKFGKSFGDADEVIITAIYPSREKPIPGVTGMTLVEALRENGHNHVMYAEDKAQLLDYLKNHLTEKHVLLTMGAGDIWKLGNDLVQKHKG
ncbi:MAG TPA: UDP-N-acetylmuramate--L-alanine ligase [bacterium]|nr:UDP-N-acetylmuramate--L-alanine ligase [bacterium]